MDQAREEPLGVVLRPGVVMREGTADETAAPTHRPIDEALPKAGSMGETILRDLKDLLIQYVDKDMRIVWSSCNLTMLRNLPVERVNGRICYQALHERNTPCPNCAVVQAIHTGKYHEVEHVTPDGQVLLMRASPVHDDAGRLAGAIKVVINITQSKQVEQKLRQSEERFRLIAENSRDLICLMDAQGQFVYASPSYEAVLGYKTDALLGRSAADLVHPDNLPRLLESQASLPTELRMRRSDGEWVWVEGHSYRIQSSGEPLWVGICRDITEQKRSREALRQTQARLEYLVNSNIVGIGISDARGTVLEANDYLLRLLGRTREDMRAGRARWVDATPPEYLGLSFQAIAEARQKGACSPYEKEYRLRDGRRVPVLVGLAALPGDEGQFVGFVVDITQRKQAEQALRQSEERLRLTTEAAQLGTWDWNLETEQLVWDERSSQLLGLSNDASQSRSVLLSRIHPDDVAMVKDRIRAAVEHGQDYIAEYRTISQDGTSRWIFARGKAFRGPTGKAVRLAGVAMDITDRKNAEESLRTSQGQLLQAQKMEAIGLLAGGIAHDFRNQLTVIKGYSEMLLRRNMVDPTARECVEEILKAANRSAALTAELLAFGRKEVLRPETVDLNEDIREIAKTLHSALGEDVSLSIIAATDLDRVRIDPGQFQQALINLAMNARDAMPEGGQVTIETTNLEAGREPGGSHPQGLHGPHVLVTIRDTGIGMDKQVQARIFEPFFTTKPVGRGTGLGLSMVYGFVKQSGGYIDVISRQGQGTTFRLYFPSLAHAPRPSVQSVQSSDLEPGTGTILLAEDESAIRQLTVLTLQECGYTVMQAADGLEAMRRAEAHSGRIDLLITDVVMPGMNGCELVRRLRQRYPNVRVLYVSGYGGDALTQRGVAEEQADVLLKPFDARQMAETVRRILGGEGPARQG